MTSYVCKGIKINGSQCTQKTKNITGFCRFHLQQHKYKYEKPDECPICMCEFSVTTEPLKSCNHWVCMECVKKFSTPECPICRQSLVEVLDKSILELIQQNGERQRREAEEEEFEELQNELQNEEILFFVIASEEALCFLHACADMIIFEV